MKQPHGPLRSTKQNLVVGTTGQSVLNILSDQMIFSFEDLNMNVLEFLVKPHFYTPLPKRVSGGGGHMFKAWCGWTQLFCFSYVCLS